MGANGVISPTGLKIITHIKISARSTSISVAHYGISFWYEALICHINKPFGKSGVDGFSHKQKVRT